MDFNLEDVTLSHPHDFFRIKHLGAIPGNCFVLMPFAEDFTIVYETIERALRGLMSCTRADDLRIGKPILARTLHGIGTAELIIADLTGKNSNVFYELGLAHARTKNVLLLTQKMEDIPFDLRGFFCRKYSPHSQDGLRKLSRIVREAAEEVRARTLPQTLEGAMARTQKIVSYMKQQLDSPKGVKHLILRMQASISSIGNTARLQYSEPDRTEYSKCLEEEARAMISLIERGASLQAIISPHASPLAARETNKERKARLDQLIDFISTRNDCMSRCQFVVSPAGGSNLLFFGEDVLFEGLKTEIQRGFGWIMIYTDKSFLDQRIEIFDRLFESARLYTLRNYGKNEQTSNDNDELRKAVLTALFQVREVLT